MPVKRQPEILGFHRVKDSHGDRVVANILLRGIKGSPIEQQDIDQALALRLMAALAEAVARVGR